MLFRYFFPDMNFIETEDKGIKYLLKKILKYQKLIKKLKSDIEIEKLKTNSCSCQNFPQHIFKENELICIKVRTYILKSLSKVYS